MRTSRFLWFSLLLLYLVRNFSFIVFRHYPSPLYELLLGLPLRAFIHFCTFSPSRRRVIRDTFILAFHYLPGLYLFFFFLFIFELLIGSHWSPDVFYYCCCCSCTLSATDLIGLFFALRCFLPYTPWYLLFYRKWFRFERMFFLPSGLFYLALLSHIFSTICKAGNWQFYLRQFYPVNCMRVMLRFQTQSQSNRFFLIIQQPSK